MKQILVQTETIIKSDSVKCSKPCTLLCALKSGCPVYYVDEYENMVIKKER